LWNGKVPGALTVLYGTTDTNKESLFLSMLAKDKHLPLHHLLPAPCHKHSGLHRR